MDPLMVPVLTAVTGVAVRGITAVELFARLRWQQRQRSADRSSLEKLARTLPRGCQLDERRADGSELHLVTAAQAEPAERPAP
jgi:hypothetical protein